MIPLILCYLKIELSVEFLGPMTPQFSKPDPQSPSFQTRLMPLIAHVLVMVNIYWLLIFL